MLLASPAAAASPWVDREIIWWRGHRDFGRLLLVLTDGELAWNAAGGDFDWARTTAISRALAGYFDAEPLWVDLRWARTEQLSIRHSRFREEIAILAAPVHATSPDDLESEDLRQHRRLRAVTRAGVAMLTALVVAMSTATWFALDARDDAVRSQRETAAQQRTAISRGLAGAADAVLDTDPPEAIRRAAAAFATHGDPQSRSTLVGTLTGNRHIQTMTGHERRVTAVAYAPGGGVLASGSADGRVLLWDVDSPGHPERIGDPLDHVNAVSSLAYSPAGDLLAAGAYDGSVRVWDVSGAWPRVVATTSPTATLTNMQSVAFSADGTLLVAGGLDDGDDGGTLITWQVAGRGPLLETMSVRRRTNPIVSIAFAPRGRALFVGILADQGSGVVESWDLRVPTSPSRVGAFVSDNPISQLAVASDGSTLAVASAATGRNVILLDVSDRSAPAQIGDQLMGHANGLHGVAFSPDGDFLVEASSDQTMILWDVSERDEPLVVGEKTIVGHQDAVTAVAFAPDGRTLASGGADNAVMLWDATRRPQPVRVGTAQPEVGFTNTEARFSPDGAVLAAGQRSGSVVLYAVDGQKGLDERGRVPLPPAPRPADGTAIRLPYLRFLEFLPDSHVLLVGASSAVEYWDVTDPGRPLRRATLDPNGALPWDITFSADGRTAVSGDDDEDLVLWRVTSQQRLTRIGRLTTLRDEDIHGFAISADSRVVTTVVNSRIQFWDISEPTKPRQTGRTASIENTSLSTLAFSPDGRTLAIGNYVGTASEHGTVTLWDLRDPGRPTKVPQTLGMNTNTIESIAFSSDGRTLAVGSWAGTLVLWDLTDRARPRALGEPGDGLRAIGNRIEYLRWSPSGRRLVTGDDREQIALWALDGLADIRADPLRDACARGGGGLDPATWRFYAQELPYQDPCRG